MSKNNKSAKKSKKTKSKKTTTQVAVSKTQEKVLKPKRKYVRRDSFMSKKELLKASTKAIKDTMGVVNANKKLQDVISKLEASEKKQKEANKKLQDVISKLEASEKKQKEANKKLQAVISKLEASEKKQKEANKKLSEQLVKEIGKSEDLRNEFNLNIDRVDNRISSILKRLNRIELEKVKGGKSIGEKIKKLFSK